jgi:protein-L-isoaspartate(D-aspartate) O-methyltransferase
MIGFNYKKLQLIGLIALSILLGCSRNENMKEQDNFHTLRQQMVDRQIRDRGIKDAGVLKAIATVPRHEFIPMEQRSLAYTDQPLPIGSGQTISQPYIVAFMSEQLKITKNDRVLEIGAGSGYQAAVLAELADSVFTIEIIPELAVSSQKTLSKLNYDNVVVKEGDGYAGWPEKMPFDCIIVTAAPSKIPPLLLEQLKIGGRMVLPVGEFSQELVLVTKSETGLEMENILPVRFVPMTGKIRDDR